MTFDEEFNNGFNTSVWNDHLWYETSNTTKNYSVDNGTLHIWPQRDSTGNFFNRTIDTDGKFYQTYGYFEMEAKLPVGKGTWPAFWLFNHIGTRRPEIDMMEAYAGGASPWGAIGSDGQPHPTEFASTIWLDAGVQAGMQKLYTGDLSTAFHKYAIKWEANKQTFYFDGQPFYSVNVSMPDPMYIILDLWFGSASGTPDSTTPTGESNSYQVNYVRAWKIN
jgi:beta-glucanase (GH16 family)